MNLRLPSFLAGFLVLSVTARAWAEPTRFELSDGSVVQGEVLELTVGVRVRVALPDGTVRELRWTELRSVPDNTVTTTTAIVHEGPDDPMLWTLPRVGTTPAILESEGDPLVVTAPGRGPLCSTPCMLYLQPGEFGVRLGGAGVLETPVILSMESTPRRFILHAPTPKPSLDASIVIVTAGLIFTGAGAAFAAAGPTLLPSVPALESPFTWIGLGLMAVGLPFAGVGIVVAVPARQGIARVESLALRVNPQGLSLALQF